MFKEEEMNRVAEDLVSAGADLMRVGVGNFSEFNLVFTGSPLQWAIMARSTQAIEILVKLGADLNQEVPRPMVECLEYSTTPLDLAVLQLMPEIVGLLVRLGTNIKLKRSDGKAPIHYIGDALDPFRLWLYHGTDIERAVTETVEVLLNHGADLNDHSKFTSTPLDCISTMPVDLTFVLAPFLKFSPDLSRGLLRVTAVSLCHDQAGHKKMALLLDYCSKHWAADIFAAECREAIRTCVQYGTVAAAREILENLVDEASKLIDNDELTHLAAENDHPEMIELLLNYGASIDLDTGGTPAAAAASRSKRNSLGYLLSKGASVYSQPTLNSGTTLLHEIVSETSSRHESETTLHLICRNQDFLARFSSVLDNFDERGFTALHEAVIWGSLATVVSLLDMGAKDRCVHCTDISTASLAQLAMEHNPWLIRQQASSGVRKYNIDMKQILEFLVVSVGFKRPDQIRHHDHVTKFWTRPSPSLWKENDRLGDWYNPRAYTDTGRDSDSDI
jgi:ankyrin repeat protein